MGIDSLRSSALAHAKTHYPDMIRVVRRRIDTPLCLIGKQLQQIADLEHDIGLLDTKIRDWWNDIDPCLNDLLLNDVEGVIVDVDLMQARQDSHRRTRQSVLATLFVLYRQHSCRCGQCDLCAKHSKERLQSLLDEQRQRIIQIHETAECLWGDGD